MKKRFCKIDNSTCISRSVFTRSNKKIKLYYCKKCDFEFFSHDPRKSLEQNKLDISRLKKAGLKIPKLVEDFKNGILQSKIYINNHMDKKDKKKKHTRGWMLMGLFFKPNKETRIFSLWIRNK